MPQNCPRDHLPVPSSPSSPSISPGLLSHTLHASKTKIGHQVHIIDPRSATGGSSVPASWAPYHNTLIFLSPSVVSSLVAMIPLLLPSCTLPSPYLFSMPL